MSSATRGWAVLLLVALVVLPSCSRSPESQKARHLERGDAFSSRDQYREAILEYQNVLRYDPANAHALKQLGLAHYQLGEFGMAFRYLLKAEELSRDDLDVRLKLATIYSLVRRTDDANREIKFILDKEPKNLDGLALLAGMAATREEVDEAIRHPTDFRRPAEIGAGSQNVGKSEDSPVVHQSSERVFAP